MQKLENPFVMVYEREEYNQHFDITQFFEVEFKFYEIVFGEHFNEIRFSDGTKANGEIKFCFELCALRKGGNYVYPLDLWIDDVNPYYPNLKSCHAIAKHEEVNQIIDKINL